MDKLTVARFPTHHERLQREWGEEIIGVVAPGKYSFKAIWMKPNAAGGLQKHHLKDEAGYIVRGGMTVIYDPTGEGKELAEAVLGVADFFHFPTGCVHKAIADADGCLYVEASTPHFNDRVHCEHEYGIEKEEGGLPSTKLEEVEVR